MKIPLKILYMLAFAVLASAAICIVVGLKTGFWDVSNNTGDENISAYQPVENAQPQSDSAPGADATPPQVDFQKVKPDESGKIMIIMFHNFVETFKPAPYDEGEYTTTFAAFRELLRELYDKGYRPISMKDYLENNIDVAAGCTPCVLTFDDGTLGQFHLVEENGELVAAKNSAVGIMEEFNREHPDFRLAGVFYVNLGNGTFEGKGSLAERLKYLIDKGFEIGNHTYTHTNLGTAGREKIIEALGRNQKRMIELIQGYNFDTLSLPYGEGAYSQHFADIVQGEYEGVRYQNKGIFLVGANPANPSVVKGFNPHAIPRVRSNGINPVNCDLQWWLEYFVKNPSEKYVSDGDRNTVTVPEKHRNRINDEALKEKKIVTY